MSQKFLRYIGIVLVLGGIIGFIFPMHGIVDLTLPHNVIHLITGILALAVSGNEKHSPHLTTAYGVIYTLIGVVGCFTRDIAGLITLDPADSFVHLTVGLVALYIGWVHTARKFGKGGLDRRVHTESISGRWV